MPYTVLQESKKSELFKKSTQHLEGLQKLILTYFYLIIPFQSFYGKVQIF